MSFFQFVKKSYIFPRFLILIQLHVMTPLVTEPFCNLLGRSQAGKIFLNIFVLIHETPVPVSYKAVRFVLLTVKGTKGLDGFFKEEESLLMVFFSKP